MTSAFEEVGAARFDAVLDDDALARIAALFPAEVRAGKRLSSVDIDPISEVLEGAGSVGLLASKLLSAPAFPVRALLFDKGMQSNWTLAPHQDRTIAVAAHHDVPGFGPWTLKEGQIHVQPPQSVIDAMVTLRVHIDQVDARNAPLEVIAGSHRSGRLTEDAIKKLTKVARPMECLAESGDVWAYRTAIVHWSRASQGKGRRRVLQVDYACDDLPHPLEWAYRSL